MSIEIKVPELPESVADAVVANWYKQPGDRITADEVLVDLETDKVILEVPVVKAGIVSSILYSVGDTVTAGQVLAVVDESMDKDVAAEKTAAVEQPAAQDASGDAEVKGNAAAMSPSVRKMISQHSIDAALIQGTGKNGRILKHDVEKYLAESALKKESATAVEPAVSGSPQPVKRSGPVEPAESVVPQGGASAGGRLERRVPMTRLRARIAERLVQSQQQAAILTTFNEVNMKPVMDIRARYRDAFEKKFGVRLGFMSFFVQASVEALKRFPEVNASIDGNDIVYHGYYDVGVAVSGPNGLVVPVIRNADILTIAELETAIIEFANKARDNSLSIEDITGGTFTISNGGVFGSMLSTPIINPPQSAILGMHNISERAMVVDGKVEVLPVMYLALSYDHRLIDGKSAVQFLVNIKQLLEEPARILLGV